MKYLFALAFLIVAAQASPLKADEKLDSSKDDIVKFAETTTPLNGKCEIFACGVILTLPPKLFTILTVN